MAYTTINFKTKKALKEAVDAYNEHQKLKNLPTMTVGAVIAQSYEPPAVTVFQPGPFPLSPYGQVKTVINGEVVLLDKVALEGPHYPEPHRWYAEALVKDGKVVRVK